MSFLYYSRIQYNPQSINTH